MAPGFRLGSSLMLAVGAALASGCGSYALRGCVIEGGNSMILFVPEDDPSLEYGQPVTDAMVSLTRDPDQLNRETVATARSGPAGWFTMPVDTFGAGWMDEYWEATAQAGGYERAQQRFRLPDGDDGMIMLIILAPGMDSRDDAENLLEQLDRFR